LGARGRAACLAAAPGEVFLCCVVWQELRLGVLPFLSKAIGAGMTAMPKTLIKGAINSVDPDLQHFKMGDRSVCPPRPTDLGSG